MGDFNPNSPMIRGMESWRPKQLRTYLLDSVNKGLMMRFKSGGAVTVSALDLYVAQMLGAPGLGAEVLSDGAAQIPVTQLNFPSTDTGATVANWQTQAGGAATFAVVDDIGVTTDYLQNTAAINTSPGNDLLFRSNGPSFTGRRIVKVTIKCVARLGSGAGSPCILVGLTSLGAGNLEVSGGVTVPPDNVWRTYELSGEAPAPNLGIGSKYVQPSTQLPWTAAQLTAIVNGTDEFGLRTYGLVRAATALNIASLWIEVQHIAENRVGFDYTQALAAGVPPSWLERTLGSTAAMVANTWYWLHLFNFVNAGAGSWWSTPILGADPSKVIEAPLPTSTTTEHRKVYETVITPGGVVLGLTAPAVGEMVPVLFDRAGTIETQSQPYSSLALPANPVDITSASTGLWGTEITSAAGATLYQRILAVIGWQDPAQRPDAPLTIEIRRGAGSMTGGGTLDATAVLGPDDLATGELQDITVVIASGAGFTTQVGATQYFLRLITTATPGRGWRVARALDLPAGASIFGGAPTQAELDGATQGGATDSLFFSGAEFDPQDMPMAFASLPTAPGGLAATIVPEVCEEQDGSPVDGSVRGKPGYVRVSWTATALGASFKCYRVYRRPRRSPIAAWEQLAEISIPVGYTAAVVEAQHIAFDDYGAGKSMAGGQWADGWDYTVTVVHATLIESAYAAVVTAQLVPIASSRWWFVCNSAPYLASLIPSARQVGGGDEQVVRRYKVAGRDMVVARTPLELPAREYRLSWDDYSGLLEDPLRYPRAAAASGRVLTLLGPLGQKIEGILDAPSGFEHGRAAHRLGVEHTFIETRRTPSPSNYNLAAGLVFDGVDDRVTHPDTGNLLDPGAGGLSVVMLANFSALAGNASAIAKFSGGDGYQLGRDGAGNFRWYVDGASAAASALEPIANWTGQRVAIGTHTPGVQILYRDGVQVATTAVATGAVANADVLSVGAASGGSGWAAMAPGVLWAVYLRVLTPTEVVQATRAALGWPGYRFPAGAAVMVDLRDLRSWAGVGTTVLDLSGNALHGTIAGAPVTRGIPWALADLERF